MSDRAFGLLICVVSGFALLYGWRRGEIAIKNATASRNESPMLFGAGMAFAGLLFVMGAMIAVHAR
jgi:predicted transporter